MTTEEKSPEAVTTPEADIERWARLVAASPEVIAELAAETLRETKAARDARWANMPDNMGDKKAS